MLISGTVLVLIYCVIVAYCVYKDRYQEPWDGRYFIVFAVATLLYWWLFGLLIIM